MRSAGEPSGFAAGTLVHTREGLRPIEDVAAGDFVLSQPQATGERGYKRVLRTSRHEDRPICRIRFSAKRGDQWVAQEDRAAADQGIGPAISNLADKYEHGKGVAKDMRMAFALYPRGGGERRGGGATLAGGRGATWPQGLRPGARGRPIS